MRSASGRVPASLGFQISRPTQHLPTLPSPASGADSRRQVTRYSRLPRPGKILEQNRSPHRVSQGDSRLIDRLCPRRGVQELHPIGQDVNHERRLGNQARNAPAGRCPRSSSQCQGGLPPSHQHRAPSSLHWAQREKRHHSHRSSALGSSSLGARVLFWPFAVVAEYAQRAERLRLAPAAVLQHCAGHAMSALLARPLFLVRGFRVDLRFVCSPRADAEGAPCPELDLISVVSVVVGGLLLC